MPKEKLTPQRVKGLPIPSGGRVDYQDTVVPGLVLRVASSGRKTYSVSYWLHGKRPRVTLGVSDDSPKRGPGVTDLDRLSLADARDRAKGVLQDVKIGLDPAAERREKREAATFAELAREYLKRHAKAKKTAKGAREDERRIENVLLPRWGTWPAGEIRKRDVVALLDEYEDAGKPYARNRMAALLSKMFNFGLDRDLAGLTTNPAARLQDHDLEKPRKRVLSDDELKVLLPLFRDAGLAGLGFELLLLTGQRPGEVFGMSWSEVDGDVWNLPKERTKNRRSRFAPDVHRVPLSTQAKAVLAKLKAYKNDSGFVFPSPKKGKPFTSYYAEARSIRKAAALEEDWEVYDLKATVLTGMQGLGFPPHVQSAVANHLIDSVTARHYALGTYETEKAEALQAWGDHVEKLDPATKAKVVAMRRRA